MEEYDEVYASYTDAKARLNNMRMSRGFYPVVALVDKGGGSTTSRSPSSSPGRGGKKGVRGKGKFRGASKGKQSPAMPKGSTARARGDAAGGRNICLRCGQSGHWARNCPQAGDKKRKVEEKQDEIMMVGPETYDLADSDDESCGTAVQDGGASSVLGSRKAVRKYLLYLLECGYDLTRMRSYLCRKGFRFGNSATERTHMCVLLPMVVAGRKVEVLTYVIQGGAPLLFGRPLLARLGVMVDYENNRMRCKDGPWKDIPLGPKGEHLLNLVDDNGILTNDFWERPWFPTITWTMSRLTPR